MPRARNCWFWGAVVAAMTAAPAQAQTIIDSSTAPQMFASNCAPCHKSPQGLAKSGPMMLAGFLRQHYTASRETADMLADYLRKAGDGPPAARGRARDAKPAARPAGGEKPAARPTGTRAGDSKPADPKPADGKPRDGSPADAKPAGTEARPAASPPGESKPSESKSSESKPAEAKPATAKPAEPKPAETKPAEQKPSEPKPAEAPAARPAE